MAKGMIQSTYTKQPKTFGKCSIKKPNLVKVQGGFTGSNPVPLNI
jgi:hypothetical protein